MVGPYNWEKKSCLVLGQSFQPKISSALNLIIKYIIWNLKGIQKCCKVIFATIIYDDIFWCHWVYLCKDFKHVFRNIKIFYHILLKIVNNECHIPTKLWYKCMLYSLSQKKPLRMFVTYCMISPKLFLNSKISCISTSFIREISILSYTYSKKEPRKIKR